jgi:hypothetical protein
MSNSLTSFLHAEVMATRDLLIDPLLLQSRFRIYEPPLMLSAISSTKSFTHSSDHAHVPTNALEATMQVEQLKLVKADPNRELCQYEQVGGTCRDSECTGLHFKDL